MARSPYSTATISGVNPYINTTTVSSEQGLVQSLTDEMISIFGQNMVYIPRNINNLDTIYLADDQSSYSTNFSIEILIENITGFSPQPNDNIFSKFGLEIRSQIVFSVSTDRFTTVVTSILSHISRPMEGDLIYFPVHKKVFQIKFTENKEIFYELGALYTFKITCELFTYSNEIFNTGIEAIDILQKKFDTNELNYLVTDESGTPITNENGNTILPENYNLSTIDPIADNTELKDEAAGILDFNSENPFGEVL